ncbi:MAG: hypothetical protein JW748_09785 [Anaerolineales bacterium]|nr:hypothetical protein [Anaerolineales bacterium]
MKRLAWLLFLLATAACQPAVTAIPTARPTEAETAEFTSTHPSEVSAPIPTETGLPPVYVPALCTLMGRPVRSDVPAGKPVILVWGWSAATEEQVRDYIRVRMVVVTFDGNEVEGVQSGGIPYDENAKLYKAVWMAAVGVVDPGVHTITYLLAFREKLFDGFDYYGPGTENEKLEDKCEIDVK